MAATGYSGTPLAKKLGIKPDARVVVLDGPPTFRAALDPVPADAVWSGLRVVWRLEHRSDAGPPRRPT